MKNLLKRALPIFLVILTCGFRTQAEAQGSSCAYLLSKEIPISAQTTNFTCGVACFHSILQYWKIKSPGQDQLAHFLGTWVNRQTYSHDIVRGAHAFGLYAQEKAKVSIDELRYYLSKNETVIVSWFLNGIGHYSVLNGMVMNHISLMDPWYARNHPDTYNVMTLEEFLPVFSEPGRLGHIIRISARPLVR